MSDPWAWPTFDNPQTVDWPAGPAPAPLAPAPAPQAPPGWPTFDNPGTYTWDGSPWPTPESGQIYNPAVDGPMTAPPPSPGPASPSAAPPPATAPSSSPAGGGQPSLDQLNARAVVDTFLKQYGLSELSDWAWQQIVNGSTPAQITLQLYDPTSDAGKVVGKLYPEIFQRQQNGLPPISIGDAVSYRNSAIQIMRAAGLPQDFYDQPDDLAKFAANDVSLAELKSRIDQGVEAAVNAPEQDRAELQRLYGVDTGHLAAFYLDPDRALPAIQKQWQAAQVSAGGVRSGFGGLSASEAEQLVGQGVSADAAQRGFGQLATMNQLFTPLPGEQGAGISREQQLAAAFSDNADAQNAIERQRRARLAVFGGGGEFAGGKTGIAGLGTAAV